MNVKSENDVSDEEEEAEFRLDNEMLNQLRLKNLDCKTSHQILQHGIIHNHKTSYICISSVSEYIHSQWNY